MVMLINTPTLSISERRNELAKDADGLGDITDAFSWSIRREMLGEEKIGKNLLQTRGME